MYENAIEIEICV